MAFDVNIDYGTKDAELRKALAAATDPAAQAIIQAQIDANSVSKQEKMASDPTKYFKYGTESEIQGAAGIMASNQLGTGYETQKANLNTSYDTAKQNANNDALSRGMARSSFVSDRMANLDSERSNALTQVDASKALALQNAKTSIIDNWRTDSANALTAEKSEFADTIGAYSDNYQQEINNVTNDGDPSNDWKLPYLNQARNAKIDAQKAAALKAASGGSYSGNGDTKTATMTYAQLLSAAKEIEKSQTEDAAYNFIVANGGQYADQLLAVTNFQPSTHQATILNDSAAGYQVGMNRTATGQLATVQKLLTSGQITEAQAQALINKFKLG